MRIRKIIIGLLLSILLGSGVAVAADFDKGFKAYQSGDFKTAVAEWTYFAEQGDDSSQYFLGLMYEYGRGVSQNDKTAVKWYTLAAEQDNGSAQSILGWMYEVGKEVEQNDNTAVKWYTLAAEQGDANAQVGLGFMYGKGRGVLTDIKRAYMWLNLASYNGSQKGDSKKIILAKKMSYSDIQQAKYMSSRCLESNYTDC